MRRTTEALIAVIGLIAVPSSVLIFHFSQLPLQPVHPTMARVVAIKAWEAKFRADRDDIVVRNGQGTGQFVLREPQVRCHVGDTVPVEQRGVTLASTATTCR